MSKNIEETVSLSDPNDAWDDTLLIKAYDDSVKLAREELARRIALSTNSQHSVDRSGSKSKASDPEEGLVSDSAAAFVPKAGDYVRATFDDGVDYEAKIMLMNEAEGTCLLKYIGYDNEQEVSTCDLVPSWGKKARRMQFARAKQVAQQQSGDEEPSMAKGNEKRGKHHFANGFESFGAVPPPPPMPPMLAQSSNLEDNEHLSAMLMSWYMSGYYTGIYQGMQMAKKTKPKK